MVYLRKRKRAATPQPKRRKRSTTARKHVLAKRNVGYARVGGYYNRMSATGSENKFLDTNLTGLIDLTGEIAVGGTPTSLCLIPQNTTESGRIGRKCTIKSLYIRMYLRLDPATSVADTGSYTIAIVLDKQANGAYPAYLDIFGGDNITSALNLSNSQRFVILKRWVGVLNATTSSTTTSDNWATSGNTLITYFGGYETFEYYSKLDIPLEFSSTTGAITELRSNNIFIAWASEEDDVVDVQIDARIRYSDK